MLDTLRWFLAIELLGLVTFPLTFALFPRLPDRGYAFAKPLGLVLLAYPVWLLGSFEIVAVSRPVLFVVLGLMTVMGALLALWHQPALSSFLSREWRTLVVGEGVFVLFFGLWTLYRAYDPAFTHTEKPMDFALLNASLLASSFPPADPWLSGFDVSYYYFGYLMHAFLAQISFVSAPVAYNLGLSLVAGLAAMGAFGLVFNLARLSRMSWNVALLAGVAGPLFLLGLSNLEGFLELVARRNWAPEGFWEWLNLRGVVPGSATGWVPTEHWWWWDATRFLSQPVGGGVQEIISEFPLFSLMLGDLHPHLMALPFGLLSLAFGLNLVASPDALRRSWFLSTPLYLPLAALVVGAVAFVNVWDMPTYASLLAAALLVAMLRIGPIRERVLARLRLVGLGLALGVVALAGLLYLPFYQHLGTQAQAPWILPLNGPDSRQVHLLIFWGLPLFVIVTLALTQLWDVVRSTRLQWSSGLLAVLAVSLAFAPFVAWVGYGGTTIDILERLLLLLPWLLLLAVLVYGLLARVRQETVETGTLYALLLAATGVLLIIGSELFYVVDFFGTRMNTVFKLYYQSWTLLALASAWGLGYLARAWLPRSPLPPLLQAPRILWGGAFLALLLASLYYPFTAPASKAGNDPGIPTLDGLRSLAESDPADYAAIQWLREHATVKETLVEAVGGQYSAFGRLSAFTGIPTVLGWEGHEAQWRGGDEAFRGRAEDVRCIYTCGDVEQVGNLLREYGVDYVVVGRRERATYAPLTSFGSFLEVAFPGEGVTIYRVPQ